MNKSIRGPPARETALGRVVWHSNSYLSSYSGRWVDLAGFWNFSLTLPDSMV